jgi:mRNA-degrading endonuclease RelE of RelBE toxin-antitoxin system
MVFIETSLFTHLLPRYLDDDEYSALQWYLLMRPDAGPIVRGSGGVRKVRWAIEGRGKRGGVRVMYYWAPPDGEIWLLTIYGKNERATIPGNVLKQFMQELRDE